MLPATMPSVSGVTVSPEPVAESPTTFTMKRGRKTMEERNVAPSRKFAAFATPKVRLPKRRRSNSGSAARRSLQTKAAPKSTAEPSSPRISGESQPCPSPGTEPSGCTSESPNSRGTTAQMSSSAPATSRG